MPRPGSPRARRYRVGDVQRHRGTDAPGNLRRFAASLRSPRPTRQVLSARQSRPHVPGLLAPTALAAGALSRCHRTLHGTCCIPPYGRARPAPGARGSTMSTGLDGATRSACSALRASPRIPMPTAAPGYVMPHAKRGACGTPSPALFARADVAGNAPGPSPHYQTPRCHGGCEEDPPSLKLRRTREQPPRQRPERNGDPVSAAIVSRYSTNDALTGRRTRLLCPGSERAADSTLQSVALKRCRQAGRSGRTHAAPLTPNRCPAVPHEDAAPPAACPARPGGYVRQSRLRPLRRARTALPADPRLKQNAANGVTSSHFTLANR